MPIYFASDIHLRLDYPERGERLARFVGGLRPGEDRLIVVGDLCDFWFASRQLHGHDELPCRGLRALAEFAGQGGDLTILPGNHDAWLGPYYEAALGARFLADGRLELEYGGRRLLALHGHRLGARPPWKHAMESRAFLNAFRWLPGPVADRLDHLLDRNNSAERGSRDLQYLELYRRRAAELAGTFDLIVLGHIHRAIDLLENVPRLVVLGDWKSRACYLRVEGETAAHIVTP